MIRFYVNGNNTVSGLLGPLISFLLKTQVDDDT